MPEKPRCSWAASTSPLNLVYHDEEWGVPVRDDRTLFEFLILEGAQAGLSWETILKKRAAFRKAFRGFDPAKVARFGAKDIERLLADEGIVRNQAKIVAAIANAQRFIDIQREFGSFDTYIWRFVGGRPLQNSYSWKDDLPAMTEDSQEMSADLKRRGFKFVGPTICYAFMQAVGMVNDHEVDCFRYEELS